MIKYTLTPFRGSPILRLVLQESGGFELGWVNSRPRYAFYIKTPSGMRHWHDNRASAESDFADLTK